MSVSAIKPVLSTVVLAAMAATLVGFAPSVATESPPQDTPSARDMMKGIKSQFRALNTSVDDASMIEKSLEHVTAAQILMVKVKAAEPRNAKVLDGDAKAEYLKGYRLAMIDLLRETFVLESHLLNGELEKARESMTKIIKDMQKDGHDKFKKRQ